ncbi:MAG: serine/threonine-protein kinase PknK [Myxococcales bacterium]|nr:serine/threonine-protein kinase PknK [Myxococcales bacterium]
MAAEVGDGPARFAPNPPEVDGGGERLDRQIAGARTLAGGLEVQHLKSSVRERLFGIADAPTVVGGHTIRRLIGRGGMGAVYEASDERGDTVALKTLHGFDPAALFRLKQEFRALADLDHPNLVGLRHLVVAGDQVFVTMESIDGRDFLAEVRAGTEVAALLPQLVAGVAALHDAGKVHRDIKPSNVLVTPGGRVVLLDFGLVHEWGGPRGELVGTPAYMAPELLLGAAPTPASDWYSVGVMLYEALTGTLPHRGDPAEILHARLAADPTPPDVLAPAGDPALAALCRRLLARDPERRAGARDILAALGAAPPTRAGTPRGLLVGRDDALAFLHRAHAEALARAAGPATLVLVRGDAGVGKTTLVQAFLDRLAAPDDGDQAANDPQGPPPRVERAAPIVLTGRCYEREDVPHNAFDSLVDALTAHLLGLSAADQAAALAGDVVALAHLFPVLRRLPALAAARRPAPDPGDMSLRTGLRDRAYVTLRRILAWLSARAPVVLYIDDLQWADADSAALLAALAADAPPRCLLLASLGADDSGPSVQLLLHRLADARAPVRELRLGPLDAGASLTLARLLTAGDADAAVVARESTGLPLFLHELVHALRDMSSGTDVSACRFEDLVAARAARLPDAASELLAALAVAGRPLAADFAARLAPAGHAGLRQLRAARLVRTRRTERGEAVELYHDKIRETVLARIDPAGLRDHHRRLADALAEQDDPAELEALAHHLRGAGQTERARDATVAAARHAAATLAFHRAAELLLAALELSPHTDAVARAELRVEAGVALAAAGRCDEAANCFLAAAASSPPLRALELRRRAAETLLQAGAVARGRAQIDRLLVDLGMRLPRSGAARSARVAALRLRLRARGLGFTPRREAEIDEAVLVRLDTLRAARIAIVQHDPTGGSLYQLELLLQVLDVGEPGRIVRAFAGHAGYLSHETRRYAEARRLLDLADEHTARHGLVDAVPFVTLCRGLFDYNLGDWSRALTHLDAAGLPLAQLPAHAFEAQARAILVGVCGVWALDCLFFLGDLTALAERRKTFLELVRRVGDRRTEARLRMSWQMFAALAADDPDEASRELVAAARECPPDAFPVERAHGTLAAWVVGVYLGDGPRAWARLAAEWPAYVRSYMYLGPQGRGSGEFWRGATALLAARRRPAEAAALLAEAAAAERVLTAERARWTDPLAQLLRAGLAQAHGRDDRAQAALAVAIAGLDAQRMQLWAAAARWHAARLARDPAREAAAVRRMRELGVTAPARMAACLVPVRS